jgi:uncharacterized protein YjiS (DUF1127 family)
MIATKPHLFVRTGSGVASRAPDGGLLARVQVWLERRWQRRTLLALNDHLLKDIGVSRADAWAEGQKPFWRG